jgi:hypothetical protein
MPLDGTKQNGTNGLTEYVLIRKSDAIELLKQLEGVKRKLQAVVSTDRQE